MLIAGGVAWLWGARAKRAEEPRRRPSRPQRTAAVALPAGVDGARLLAELRAHFVRLQAAWDLGEMQVLRTLTTPEMLEELCLELPASCAARPSSCTDVVSLHGRLLGFEELAGDFLVSVEFSGLIREGPERGAAPFRELWMLAQSKYDGSGWRLARHQTLL